MPLALRFIGGIYLHYFFMLFLGLELFFVGIDLLRFADQLPDSANLVVLLIVYNSLYAAGFIVPIALVLAQILLLITLLRTHQLTALLALGYSKQSIAFPVLLVALSITLGLIFLNATPFAYAKERADLILDKRQIDSSKRDLFVKYDDSYVYFGIIYPLLQKAERVKVYRLQDGVVVQRVEAKEAHFKENSWHLLDATVITLPREPTLGKTSPLRIERQATLAILEGFKPRILDSIYERQGAISSLDALESWILLQRQQVNSQRVRGIFYSLVLFPLFAPLCLPFVALYLPTTMRYGRLAVAIFASIIGVLVVWGVFFALSRFAMSGFIQPEMSLVVPTLFLGLFSIWGWRRLAWQS